MVICGAILCSIGVVGCERRIVIALEDVAVTPGEETGIAVLPYDKSGRRVWRGNATEWISIVVSCEADLETIGKARDVEHLYVNYFACTAAPRERILWDGDVFRVETASRDEAASRDVHRYRVFVPKSVKEMQAHVAFVPSLNAEQELEEVRRVGLCMIVGGGNTYGGGLISQVVRLPLSVVGDSFVPDALGK
jgi:hypothetical protein